MNMKGQFGYAWQSKTKKIDPYHWWYAFVSGMIRISTPTTESLLIHGAIMALLPGQVIQVVDTFTGEVVTQTCDPNAGVFMGRKRKHPGGFIIVYESDFRDAALMLRDYGANAICLWAVLMTKVEIGTGEILVNTVEIAEMMKTSRTRISSTVKLICDLGVIQQVRKDGKHFVYRMNPSIMWKGRETERQDLLKLLQGGK
jgi:hypothetical protein